MERSSDGKTARTKFRVCAYRRIFFSCVTISKSRTVCHSAAVEHYFMSEESNYNCSQCTSMVIYYYAS